MKYRLSVKPFPLALAAALLVSPAQAADDAQTPPAVSFIRDVAPILVANCQSCHGTKTAESNYRLDTFERLVEPGDFGAAPATAGDLDDSEIYRLITAEDPDERMPGNGDRLTDAQIQWIGTWIQQGAQFDGVDPAAPLKDQLPRTVHSPAPETYPTAVPISALAFSADGQRLLTGGYHEITIWDAAAGSLVQRVGDIPERVFGLELNADGSLLAVAGGTPGVLGEVRLLPWDNGPKVDAEVKILAKHGDVFFDVAFRPDGQQLAAAGSDGSVRIFDVATGEERLRIDNHADWVTDLCYSADGTRLATASRDKTAKVFDPETGELVATYSGHDKSVEAVAFSPDAKQVISAGGAVVRVWNVEDSAVVGDLPGFTGDVYSLLTDAESAIATSADRTARRFTLADRTQTIALADHPDWAISLAWHAATKRVATGCFDGSVSLWNLEDGALVKRFVAMPPGAETAE